MDEMAVVTLVGLGMQWVGRGSLLRRRYKFNNLTFEEFGNQDYLQPNNLHLLRLHIIHTEALGNMQIIYST